jgi:hypothetical protein
MLLETWPQLLDLNLTRAFPYPGERMEAFPIGLRVNNPKNDDPKCIEPLSA